MSDPLAEIAEALLSDLQHSDQGEWLATIQHHLCDAYFEGQQSQRKVAKRAFTGGHCGLCLAPITTADEARLHEGKEVHAECWRAVLESESSEREMGK